ncbi:hypothetical protein BpHYR1_033237 [Brachionus plicatilis]|uniref:Uncharacterized protein n=1 Tax=Brachionus plicatilis TaxID=10195 RepID=A0A3M7RFR3_BRAPC|nr:hypothetical protein BpHYR1_033237 [Brachionus plicatilis]
MELIPSKPCYKIFLFFLELTLTSDFKLRSKITPVSIQAGNTNRQQSTNRNPLGELNLQTNQAKSQISITSNNIANSSNR